MKTNEPRRYYPGITLFKLLGSLIVLLAHIKLPAVYEEMSHHVSGLSQLMVIVVPCFYIIAGFLACKGWQSAPSARQYVRNYLSWVGRTYALFCLVYFATSLLPGLVHAYRAGTFSLRQLNVLFEVYFITGPYPALWFIPPLLFGVGGAYLLDRLRRPLLAAGVGVAGFLLAQLVFGTLRVLLDTTVGELPVYQLRHMALVEGIVTNYLGIALPSILLGVFVARHEARFRALNARQLALLTGACVGLEMLFLACFAVHGYRYRLMFSMVPISTLLFYGVLHLRLPGIGAYHGWISRFSIIVYFFHNLLISANLLLLGGRPSHLTAGQALVCTVLTLLETVLLTALLPRLRPRRLSPAATPPPQPAAAEAAGSR